MGTLRHKNGKPAKAKRAGRKAAPRSGKAQESSATKAAKSRARATPRKRKRGAGKTAAGASASRVDKQIDPPKLGLPPGQDAAPAPLSSDAAIPTPQSPAERGPAGPAVPDAANTVTGERRRWPERTGPAATYGNARRTGSEIRGESGDSGDSPPRPNKLLPTNAVHPTERRIKRRMHKNSALMVAAGAALLGVLILNNQSEPPELGLTDRQTASRLPASQDWPSDATPDTVSKVTSRARVPDSNSPRITAPGPPERIQSAASTDELSPIEIVEMERMLSRLDLTFNAPDGVIDDDVARAIRLYQEIAGLPVDGEASQVLLADMREVVKILDGTN